MQFSDFQFDGHPPFDSRSSYNNPPVNQFTNNIPQIARPMVQNTQQILVDLANVPGVPNIPNVPAIPTGHKILMNHHFRGNQSKSEGKLLLI